MNDRNTNTLRNRAFGSGSATTVCALPLPSDDPTQRRPDIEKARTLLGWQPQIALRDGLAKTIDYFRTLA